MPQARNQEVTVRRPLAKRAPSSSRSSRGAERRSRGEARASSQEASWVGSCENGMAGPSLARCGQATVIVRGGPALGQLFHLQRPPDLLHRLRRCCLSLLSEVTESTVRQEEDQLLHQGRRVAVCDHNTGGQ